MHMRMLAHADAVPLPHGRACTCRIGSVLHLPNRSIPVVPRSTSGFGQRAPAADSITKSRTLLLSGGWRLDFGVAGDVESIAVGSLLWSCAADCTGKECTLSGTAAAATPAGLNLPHRHSDWAHPSHICTRTGLNLPHRHRDLGRSPRNTPKKKLVDIATALALQTRANS